MTTAGKKMTNGSVTLTTATTQQTVLADGLIACQNGKLIVQNPHTTAKVMLGFAGEANLSVSGLVGYMLKPGESIQIPDPTNSALTAVSDTNSSPLGVWYVAA